MIVTYPLSPARHNQHAHARTRLLLCSSTPPQLQARTFIIHRNQISEGVEESCFPLPLLLSYPSLILCTSIPSLHLLSSLHLTSPFPGKNCFLLQQTLGGAFGFRQPQLVVDAGSQGSRQPSSQAARPVRKMSNSLIVIMCLCHLPIIGMIKDEIFREAGLLT